MTTPEIILSLIAAVAASSGIWGLVMYKVQRKDAKNDKDDKDTQAIKVALKGLLHQDIMAAGETYIYRGTITVKELEDFKTYLYDPYKGLDGDGMADEIWDNLTALLHQEEDK